MKMEIQTIRERIYADATPMQAAYLKQQDLYCSPSSFYGDAYRYGLITATELDNIQRYYGPGWNYAGD